MSLLTELMHFIIKKMYNDKKKKKLLFTFHNKIV